MPKVKVTFLPLNKTIEVDTDKAPFQHDGLPASILDIALANGIDLEHACGGNCACTTCHVMVRSGMENLSEMGESEADLVDKAAGATLKSRLGCQAVVLKGEVVVEIPPYTVNQM